MSARRIETLRRWWNLSRGSRLLLLEAAVALVLSRFLIRRVPFRRLSPRIGSLMRESAWSEDAVLARACARVSGAVRQAGDHLPGEFTCLARAMAAAWMLRRRGASGTLYLGVSRREGSLQAHAWLRCGSVYVTGYENAGEFTTISCFGWEPRVRSGARSGKLA